MTDYMPKRLGYSVDDIFDAVEDYDRIIATDRLELFRNAGVAPEKLSLLDDVQIEELFFRFMTDYRKIEPRDEASKARLRADIPNWVARELLSLDADSARNSTDRQTSILDSLTGARPPNTPSSPNHPHAQEPARNQPMEDLEGLRLDPITIPLLLTSQAAGQSTIKTREGLDTASAQRRTHWGRILRGLLLCLLLVMSLASAFHGPTREQLSPLVKSRIDEWKVRILPAAHHATTPPLGPAAALDLPATRHTESDMRLNEEKAQGRFSRTEQESRDMHLERMQNVYPEWVNQQELSS